VGGRLGLGCNLLEFVYDPGRSFKNPLFDDENNLSPCGKSNESNMSLDSITLQFYLPSFDDEKHPFSRALDPCLAAQVALIFSW